MQPGGGEGAPGARPLLSRSSAKSTGISAVPGASCRVPRTAIGVVARAKTKPAAGYRFPVFAPHEQDYEPSGDHFAVFSNALQYMLIQRVDGEGTEDGDDVLLLPAWPCEWDVEFKVHAPRNAVVTGSLKNGTLAYSVVPGDRQAHVRAAKCQDSP